MPPPPCLRLRERGSRELLAKPLGNLQPFVELGQFPLAEVRARRLQHPAAAAVQALLAVKVELAIVSQRPPARIAGHGRLPIQTTSRAHGVRAHATSASRESWESRAAAPAQ